MTDQDWWIHLKETDYSFETFSIYADWLEDNDLEDKSRVIREIVSKEYRARFVSLGLSSKYKYDWWKENELGYSSLVIESCILPKIIFKHLIINKPIYESISYRYYSSLEEAYKDLIYAMVIIS